MIAVRKQWNLSLNGAESQFQTLVALLFHLIFQRDVFHCAWLCNLLDVTQTIHFYFHFVCYDPARKGNWGIKTLWAQKDIYLFCWEMLSTVFRMITAKCFQCKKLSLAKLNSKALFRTHLGQVKGCFVIVKQDCVMAYVWIITAQPDCHSQFPGLESYCLFSIKQLVLLLIYREKNSGGRRRAGKSSTNWSLHLIFWSTALYFSALLL